MKEVGDRSDEESDDDVLLVKPFSKTQKTGFAPVPQTTVNTKNTPTGCGHNIIMKALKVNKDKAICLGLLNCKG